MGLFNNIKKVFGTNSKPAENESELPLITNVSKKKILIVEDERLLANALESKFKHANFEVYSATNGKMGLDMTVANKPDIVLLDLMMPIMDGKTMLHKLREMPDFKYLPVVVLTNAGEIDNVRETKTYDNASAFLIKSNVNPDDIVHVVNDCL